MNFLKTLILPLCLICGMTMVAGCKQDDPGPNSDYINTKNTEYLVLLNKTHPSGPRLQRLWSRSCTHKGTPTLW